MNKAGDVAGAVHKRPLRLGGLIAALLYAHASQADVDFTPRIEASGTYVDNITLAGAGVPKEDDFVLQVKPGFTLEQKNATVQSYVDYTLQGVFYTGEDDRNESYNQLEAMTEAALVQDLFFLRLSGLATQQLIDPAAPVSLENILDAGGNLTNAYTASAMPRLRKRLGGTLAEARYTYGFVRYDEIESEAAPSSTLLDDSTNTRALFTWGTDPTQPQRFSWKATYDRQEADYEIAQAYRHSQANLELGLAVTRQLRLRAVGGYESDLRVDLSGGGLDEPYWQAGISIEGRRGHYLSALAGDRFFGTTYDFEYSYTGRRLQLESSYAEGPTTAADELFVRPVGDGAIIQPSIADGDLNRVTTDVFVRKYFDALARLSGRRTSLEVRLGDYRRAYIRGVTPDDRTHQATITLTRQLSGRLTAALSADRRDFKIEDGDRTDDLGVRLSLRRRITPSFDGVLALGHVQRDGQVSEYDVNWLSIAVTKSF